MNSLKALADTNLKISEVRTTLIKLEETETEYLEGREKKAVEKIQKVLDESKDLVEKTQNNYAEVHQLCVTASEFSETFTKIYVQFKEMLLEFDARSELWNKEVERQISEFTEIKKLIKLDKQTIENDKKGIEQSRKTIKNDQTHIESQRAQIKSAFEVLKQKQNG